MHRGPREPSERACRYLLCLVAAVEVPAKAELHSCSGMDNLATALTACSNPEACGGTGTVGSASTEVVPGTFPQAVGSSSFSSVCGWSVRLHHFTPGRSSEGAREVVRAGLL